MSVVALRPSKLLICDDSPSVRKLIFSMLSDQHELMLVSSGEEAFEESLRFRPDLIISDLLMDGMDGYELCKRVRAERSLRHISFILLTSKTDDDARAKGLEVGA